MMTMSRAISAGQALDYYQKSLAMREELGLPEGVATVLTNQASLFAKQKNYQQAATLIERALSISNPNSPRPITADGSASANNQGCTRWNGMWKSSFPQSSVAESE